MFITNDPQKLVKHLKKLSSLRVFVHSDIISLCSLRMFTTLLGKEIIKHEIIFTDTLKDLDLDSEYIYITSEIYEDKENKKQSDNKIINELLNNDKRIIFEAETCFCDTNRIDLLMNMYKLLKNTNYIDENSLWALIVGFSFYKDYMFMKPEIENEDSEEEEYEPCTNICLGCNEMHNSICIEVKNLDCSERDGIFYDKCLALPLLRYSNLFLSLKNDLFFVAKHKLIYRKRKDLEEYKIKGFLAKKGISIVKSNERYTNLDHASKKYILRNLDIHKMFIRKKGHTLKVSSLDCFLLMSLYIFKNESVKAYLLLDDMKTNINITDKNVSEMHDILFTIKDSIANVSKVEDLLVFKIKKDKIENFEYFIKFVYTMIDIYKRERYSKYRYIVIIDKYEETKVLVYGNGVEVCNVIVNGIKIFNRKDFYRNIVN